MALGLSLWSCRKIKNQKGAKQTQQPFETLPMILEIPANEILLNSVVSQGILKIASKQLLRLMRKCFWGPLGRLKFKLGQTEKNCQSLLEMTLEIPLTLCKFDSDAVWRTIFWHKYLIVNTGFSSTEPKMLGKKDPRVPNYDILVNTYRQ